MAAAAAAGNDGKDRIGDLPDDILWEIISHLPVREAARSTALASRWRNVWPSTPLILDDTDLPEPKRASTVARILSGHPGPFRDVSLVNCRFGPQDQDHAAEWLRHLAAKGTRNLVLLNRTLIQPPLRLPDDFIRCSSLKLLVLCSWTFPDEHLPGIFPNLRNLGLSWVSMTDQHFDHLLAACPFLEFLYFLHDTTLQRIHLRSQSLRFFLIGLSVMAEEVAVVDAPLLQRLCFDDLRCVGGRQYMRVRIARAPNLRELGYLDTGVHNLQIGDTVIQPSANYTMASPGTVVPGVKILAVKVNFGIFGQVKMLVSFLRCFPDVDTLHIESVLHDPSVTADEPTTEHHANFWQKISPVECLRSRVKKMVFHKFQWDQNEFEFLKFIARDARELQSLLVLPHEETISSMDKVNEMIDKSQCPRFQAWASRMFLVLPGGQKVLDYVKAFDITADDPFL